MSLCASSCNAPVQRWAGGCSFNKRAGGLPFLGFMSCNWKFAESPATSVSVVTPSGSTISVGLISDYTSWAIGVQNNMIRLSPEGIGEKPESTFTNARFSSCKPEEISSETHVVNFQSFDIDPDNFYDRTYWQAVRTNYAKYRLFYVDCNGFIYYSGDPSDPGFEFVPTTLGYVIPQTSNDKSYYQANLSFIYEGIPTPIEVANIDAAWNIDVNT